MKNHYNGARNPKAHLRMEVTEEKVLKAPMIAWPFGLFDCCPTTDGAAAAIVCRADIAKRFRSRLRPGEGLRPGGDHRAPVLRPDLRLPRLPLDADGGAAGVQDGRHHAAGHRASPRCTTASPGPRSRTPRTSASAQRARAGTSLHEGRTALSGDIPINPSGGLKSFGHPIGASGVRMIYECVTAAARPVRRRAR